MEVRLRELLLDIEDRIHQGTLGTLKVRVPADDGKGWVSKPQLTHLSLF